MSTKRYRPLSPQPQLHELPDRFTFPYHYQPHPLASRAVRALQQYLEQRNWTHNFGQAGGQQSDALGKMFGVLVVQTPDGEVGYLQAFSGRLEGTYDLPPFVPAVYDLYAPSSFFAEGEAELNAINAKVSVLESSDDLQFLRSRLAQVGHEAQQLLADYRAQKQAAKADRNRRRAEADSTDLPELDAQLKQESAEWSYRERDLKRFTRHRVGRAQAWVDLYEHEIKRLRKSRKHKSGHLQKRLFDQYTFLNAKGKEKGVGEIFAATPLQVPPSGAGECCAPKLLQYAFANRLKPLCMAEFWWGQSPPDLIRHHGQFYPSCRGKCEPILTHMLLGLPLEDNPLLQTATEAPLNIIYEDEYLLAVDKPGGLLSVPGRELQDSVWLRLKTARPDRTAPYSVHRLDMETSGILLLAKTADAYKKLQAQFAERTVQKTYLALLENEPPADSGRVDLSMKFDYLNRPRQIVVKNGGKAAITDYRVLKKYEDGKTLVEFHPHTGRTHQLRVHAAHRDGLHAPIVGDSLYGKSRGTLKLRAEKLVFEHPETKVPVVLHLKTDIDKWNKL